ncbi:MAG: DNA repair protein RecN [Firmicutes bacterium]|nr:DNA repair protein RecN [Bacillota bacterium]
MIDHISIRDFAIIENTEVTFLPGLNVITGETGSGKSIVITAISLALGSRADSSFVRHGQERAIVELVGTLYGEELVVSREVSASGRNLCRLNGRLVTLAELADVTRQLADIHGQYDNQSLLSVENHLRIVDNFGAAAIEPLKNAYAASYSKHVKARSELEALLRLERESRRKVDFYRYEIREIDAAKLVEGEDEDLEERVSLLKNGEKIYGAVAEAYEDLDGDRGAYSLIGDAVNELERVSSYTSQLGTLAERLNDLYYELEDTADALRRVRESLTFSPRELDDDLSRLAEIDDLKKKYGKTIPAILSYRQEIANELEKIENFDAERERLSRAEREAKAALLANGAQLSAARKQAASELAKRIEAELHDLNFQNATLSIRFSDSPAPLPDGLDLAEIYISTNLGEPEKPLVKTASGGEISRIMLAIKNVTSSCDDIPTIIFDEIDQGISGRTAAVVGRKLREISRSRQVICITHLPQIAALSDQSYRIYKESDDSSTYTHIERLDPEQKVDEIARLLGGETITEMARAAARELIGE